MQRRRFIHNAGLGTLAAGAALSGCGGQRNGQTGGGNGGGAGGERFEWKMVTTWPKDFPGMGTGANYLADIIERMSAGRLKIQVYGAGELVPAFEVFDSVSRGTAEMGHGASYYWKGKAPAAQFFAAVPFGMNAMEMNAWLFQGGGLELWRELYEPFGLVPFAAGNTGVQMAGWFREEIRSVEDLRGLKMRIPGLGAEVLKRAGGTPVNLPGGEIFTSLQSGAIDATEWVGPYNDLAFGLFRAAKNYYYPGWHEPGSVLECMVNKDAYDALPEDLQAIVRHACQTVNDDMLADYTAQNQKALDTLVNEHGVKLRKLPDDVLNELAGISKDVVAEVAEQSDIAKRIYDSFTGFQRTVRRWHEISELAFYNARASG